MSRRLVLRSGAEMDLFEAAGWYEQKQAGLGRDFRKEFWIAANRALENPHYFPLVTHATRCSPSSIK